MQKSRQSASYRRAGTARAEWWRTTLRRWAFALLLVLVAALAFKLWVMQKQMAQMQSQALASASSPPRTTASVPQTSLPVAAPSSASGDAAVRAAAAPVTKGMAQPASAVIPAPLSNLPAAQSPSGPATFAEVTATLKARRLVLPVQGVQAAQLADTFTQARSGGRVHDAIDIMAAHGTPVLAVEDGRITRLFTSQQGGITLYQFDPGEQFGYYYAHLQAYAPGISEGKMLRRGEVIGYVGSTGNANANAPHLHFAVFRLNAQKQWWKGEYLNPYLLWRP